MLKQFLCPFSLSPVKSSRRFSDPQCIGGQQEWLFRGFKEPTSNKLRNICEINSQSGPGWIGANWQPPEKSKFKGRAQRALEAACSAFSQEEELHVGLGNISEHLPNYFPNSNQVLFWLLSVLCS